MNKEIRLSELGKVNPMGAMDHRNFLNEKGQIPFLEKLPRKERRRLAIESRNLAKEYNQTLVRLSESGPKFQADKVLREMAVEYTHRYASSGIHTQPTSFNYFEPFLRIKLLRQVAPYADIEKECNHLFDVSDFFAHITSEDNEKFKPSSLLTVSPDQVYHFSTQGQVTDLAFLNAENREFSIAAFSMIRRGNSLHWYLVGGECFDKGAWDLKKSEKREIDISNAPRQKIKFLSENLAKTGAGRGNPIALHGTETHLRTIVAGEFDLERERHLSRCYLAEYENYFDVVCDDPVVFSSFDENNRSEIFKVMNERFSRSSVLWSLAESLFQLPRYFNTRLVLNKKSTNLIGQRVSAKKGGKGVGVDYTIIPSLDTKSALPNLTITRVKLPQYEIETEGHWKNIPDGVLGFDRHGNSISGKTWVEASSKWKLDSQASPVIFVKDALATARIKIEEYVEAANKVEEATRSSLQPEELLECGELYIMRCSAMKERMFKVGFTEVDSDLRARQLSSATGIPWAFVVLKKWYCKDAHKIETEVHMMLGPYRVNDSREFFLAEYDVIVGVIESVIERTKLMGGAT